MYRKQGVFERYLTAMEKSADITMRWWYQRQMMLDGLTQGREYDKLVADVGDYVIQHISATVDADEVFDKIDELNKKINDLGRNK